MADKRIKDLTPTAPVTGNEFVPFDSAGTGTVNATILDLVKFGVENMPSPTIGNSWDFESPIFVDLCTDNNHAAKKLYVDFPTLRVTSGSADSLGLYDIGATVAYPQTGSILITLTNMGGAWASGRSGQILLQFEHSGSLPIISCSGGSFLNGSTSVITGTLGCSLLGISSRDGTHWFK